MHQWISDTEAQAGRDPTSRCDGDLVRPAHAPLTRACTRGGPQTGLTGPGAAAVAQDQRAYNAPVQNYLNHEAAARIAL
jgi:hypothetical protein